LRDQLWQFYQSRLLSRPQLAAVDSRSTPRIVRELPQHICDTLAASSGFDQPSMIALASSRIPEVGVWLWKGNRQYVRNVNSAWSACTPAPLPASRRSTHFKGLRILKSPHATTACGAPSRSSDLNGQGDRPCKGEGDPKPSIRCDREWERFKRIKPRIISCAQLGSRTYERTRTNREVYYQPIGAKTQ
jgi:hypothetical protein